LECPRTRCAGVVTERNRVPRVAPRRRLLSVPHPSAGCAWSCPQALAGRSLGRLEDGYTAAFSNDSSPCVECHDRRIHFRSQAGCEFRRPFHGVWYPTTLTETGSDLHRVYLTRLCCAFRLSQPLDALFRPQPIRPCFMPVTPLGFCFQRFSLLGSGLRLSVKPALHVVSVVDVRACQGWRIIDPRLRGFTHPRSPFQTGRCYPIPAGRASPSLHLFEVYPL
jgi:hypothetical protein